VGGEEITHLQVLKENKFNFNAPSIRWRIFFGMKTLKITNETLIRLAFSGAFCYFFYSDKFRSILRLTILVLYKNSIIDLNKTPSSCITTTSKLLEVIDRNTSFKIKKKDFFILMDLSKNTFNKIFQKYLSENQLVGRRSFTLLETYELLIHWKGDAMWYRIEAFTKKELACSLTNGNYRELSLILDLDLNSDDLYKKYDKISPGKVNSFLKDLNFDDEKIEEVFLSKYNNEGETYAEN